MNLPLLVEIWLLVMWGLFAWKSWRHGPYWEIGVCEFLCVFFWPVMALTFLFAFCFLLVVFGRD